MATIIIRNSTGSGAVPSSLVQGELAINTVDGKLFYGSGSGNIVKEFTASNSLTASYLNTLNQDLTFNGNLTLNGTASISTLVINQTQYSSGSNQLGDAANDTQTLFGSVIIPTGSLVVTGSSRFNGTTLTLGTTGLLSTWQGTNHSLYFYHENSTTFRILSSLGPALDVKADSFRFVNSPLVVGANVTPLGRLHIQGTGATSATTALRVENSSASPSLVVLDNGFVGIGTGSAAYKLQVRNGDIALDFNYFLRGGFDNNWNRINLYNGSTGDLELFMFNTNWYLRHNANATFAGNVGIGLTTPSTKLHISGASNTGLLEIDSPAVNNILYVSGSGNIGINTNAPAYNLDVSGTLRVSSFPYFTAYATSVQRVQFNNGTVAGNLGYIRSFLNGVIQLTDNSEGDFNRLCFGGGTSLFPALQRSGSSLCVVDAAGGTNTSLLVGLSGSAYGSTGTSNGKLTINNTSGNNGLAIRIGETGYQLAVRTTTNDAIGTEFVWYDGATITFLQYGGTLGARLGASGFAQFRANNYNPDATATIHTGNSNLERFRVTSTGLIGIGTSSPSASLHVAGTTRLSGSFNTAASGSILTVIGSGSTQPIFTVQGSQGELFSITDSLTGSLFSVNDISGLPILEVFSDNTTLIGDYQDPMLITTKKVTMTNSGSFVVYSLPTASYDTAFFDYSIKSGSNARAGQIMAIQSGSSVNFTETTTTDFGSTTAVSFTVLVSGSNMVLTGSAATGSWTIKTIVRGL